MKILYLYPSDQPQIASLANSLKSALPEADIHLQAMSWNSLFQFSKFDLVHAFIPANSSYVQRLQNKFKDKRSIVTFTSVPENVEDYKKFVMGDRIVVFTTREKVALTQQSSVAPVVVIPPCIQIPSPASLAPSNKLRASLNATERMLAVALNEIRDEQQFKVFLYIAREYNRKDDFRFVIPRLGTKDRAAASWREKLKTSVAMEKLESAIIAEQPTDLHSFIDCCDVTIYTSREVDSDFHFNISAGEALVAGKAVICFSGTTMEEFVAGFEPKWVARAMEDFVRISRDIARDASTLEQVSTDLARYARNLFAPEKVAHRYNSLYKDLLG